MSMDRRCDLAEQVLFEILLYLPVLSLLRFKAICKYWFSLIDSSSFISEHLNHNRDSTEDNFVFRSHGEGLVLHSGSQYEECVYYIDTGQFWDFWHPAHEADLIAYCDGIICLAHSLFGPHCYEIALWNPALKQLRPLPPPLFHDRIISSQGQRLCSIDTSFGIDIKRNNYKLVRILLIYSDGDVIGNQVEVYNLGGDNSWRITHKDEVLPFHYIYTLAAVSSSKYGKCFWIADRCYNDERILLSFDFSDEAFRTMQLPLVDQNDVCDLHCNLDLVDDKVVCILALLNDEIDTIYEIWMLHEFGVNESWKKIFKIGPLTLMDLFDPLLVSRNGEFLICSKFDITTQGGQCVEVGENTFYLFNLHTRQGKFHQSCNINLNGGQLIHYNASLLSLKSVNHVRTTG